MLRQTASHTSSRHFSMRTPSINVLEDLAVSHEITKLALIVVPFVWAVFWKSRCYFSRADFKPCWALHSVGQRRPRVWDPCVKLQAVKIYFTAKLLKEMPHQFLCGCGEVWQWKLTVVCSGMAGIKCQTVAAMQPLSGLQSGCMTKESVMNHH